MASEKEKYGYPKDAEAKDRELRINGWKIFKGGSCWLLRLQRSSSELSPSYIWLEGKFHALRCSSFSSPFARFIAMSPSKWQKMNGSSRGDKSLQGCNFYLHVSFDIIAI
jgi:hypothetical protein